MGSIHGFPVGVIANQQGVIFSEEAQKVHQFIQLSNRYDTPLVFIHNTTGYMVGRDYEQRGIIKDGAKMVNAVANSEVPVAVMAGVSWGGELWHVRPLLRPSFRLWLSQSQGSGDGPHSSPGSCRSSRRQAAESRGETRTWRRTRSGERSRLR